MRITGQARRCESPEKEVVPSEFLRMQKPRGEQDQGPDDARGPELPLRRSMAAAFAGLSSGRGQQLLARDLLAPYQRGEVVDILPSASTATVTGKSLTSNS